MLNAGFYKNIKIAYAEFEKLYKKKLKRKQFICLYHMCKARAIQSHSQQKKGQLKHIHEKNHVFSLHESLCNSFNEKSGKLEYEFKLNPISQVSRYPGLCNKHDTSIFKDIESGNIKTVNDVQAAAFHFRATTYEVLRQKREIDRLKYFIKKMGLSIPNTNKTNLNIRLQINQEYFDESVLYHLSEINKIIDSKDYNSIIFIHKKIDKNIGVSCTSMVNMYLDRYLEHLNESSHKSNPSFSFSIIPEERYTHVIFAWLKEYDKDSHVIRTYIEGDFEQFLNRLIFCECEDACIKPNLWKSFSKAQKDYIMQCMKHRLTRGILYDEMVPKIITIDSKNLQDNQN